MTRTRRALFVIAAVALSCDADATCDDRCGEGTTCVAGKCVVASAEPEATVEASEPEDAKARGRRRRGGRRGRDPDDDTAPAGPIPKFDDSSVPRYDDARGSSIGEGAGSERISDRTIRQHLSRNESKLNHCITELAEAGVDVATGQVSFEIGIDPSGKVWGVSAQAPAAMKSSGLVACMRLAISRYRFPSWDGPPIAFEYSFEVG